jgi:hypothetical protein
MHVCIELRRHREVGRFGLCQSFLQSAKRHNALRLRVIREFLAVKVSSQCEAKRKAELNATCIAPPPLKSVSRAEAKSGWMPVSRFGQELKGEKQRVRVISECG